MLNVILTQPAANSLHMRYMCVPLARTNATFAGKVISMMPTSSITLVIGLLNHHGVGAVVWRVKAACNEHLATNERKPYRVCKKDNLLLVLRAT